MKKINKIFKYIIINIFILVIIYLFYLKGIRICLIYNVFHVPCVGCGLTRAIICLLQGNFMKSIQYNLLAIPICLIYSLMTVWYIIDAVKEENSLQEFLNKNKKKIIVICIILFLVSTIKNLTNPLLY